MSGYTPGPWVFATDGSNSQNNRANYITGASGTLIVYGQANDADARLISAAPDLLEALQGFIEGAEAMGWNTDKARAAIAKATGEQA